MLFMVVENELCGLLYVGEDQRPKLINESVHIMTDFRINNSGNQLLWTNISIQTDHSILSMKVRILDKIYHHTNNPTLSTPYRRKREEYWIRLNGIAKIHIRCHMITSVSYWRKVILVAHLLMF